MLFLSKEVFKGWCDNIQVFIISCISLLSIIAPVRRHEIHEKYVRGLGWRPGRGVAARSGARRPAQCRPNPARECPPPATTAELAHPTWVSGYRPCSCRSSFSTSSCSLRDWRRERCVRGAARRCWTAPWTPPSRSWRSARDRRPRPSPRASSLPPYSSTSSSASPYPGDPEQTTPSWGRCPTPTSTATSRSTPGSSRTRRPAARPGTTATSTGGRRPSSAPTGRSSPKPSSSATGGSTSSVASPRSSTPSTTGSTGGPRSTPPGPTGLSLRRFSKIFFCDFFFYKIIYTIALFFINS